MLSFNPRARDGRDRVKSQGMITSGVSIHAPVMDAINHCLNGFCLNGFNPRARDGRDINGTERAVQPFVSIHAPVMDAIK